MLRYLKDRDYLFVDGYNIINSWEIFKDTMKVDLEKARIELIDLMIEYAHVTDQEVILVYDAYRVKKSPGKIYKVGGIYVVFTKEFETADHFIEKELDKIGRVRRVRVATSDKIEQQIILQRGGSRISAMELFAEVESERNKIERKSKDMTSDSKNHIGALDENIKEQLVELKDNLKE